MEIGSFACFSPSSCNNLILQVIQTKHQRPEIAVVKGQESYSSSSIEKYNNDIKNKKCSLVYNKKDNNSSGIVKFPYRNHWKKVISKSIISSVNHALDQCPINHKTRIFKFKRNSKKQQQTSINEDSSVSSNILEHKDTMRENQRIEEEDDDVVRSFANKTIDKNICKEEVSIRSFLDEHLEEKRDNGERNLRIRSFLDEYGELEDTSTFETCSSLDEGKVESETPSSLKEDIASEVCVRSFLEDFALQNEKLVSYQIETEEKQKPAKEEIYVPLETCTQSFLEAMAESNNEDLFEHTVERVEIEQGIPLKENDAHEACNRIFWKEITLNLDTKAKETRKEETVIIEAICNRSFLDEPEDSTEKEKSEETVIIGAICNRSFLDEPEDSTEKEESEETAIIEAICNRSFLDEPEDSTEKEASEVLIVDNELCFDETSFLALMNYKPKAVKDIDSHESKYFYSLMNIPIQEQNETGNMILHHKHMNKHMKNFTLHNINNLSKTIDATYSIQILQEDHMTPILFFSIGIVSGIIAFFFIILHKNGKNITDEIPCCSESQTSSTYSNTQQQQPPPSLVLQQQIQILSPPGPLGIVLQPSVNGPTIFCINPKSAMIGIFYPGDIIVAIEMEDVIDWKVNVLMLWITRNSRKPRLFTILR